MQAAFSHRLTPVLVLVTLATASVALAAYAYKTFFKAEPWDTNTISVTGEAERTMIPDIATFSLAVRVEGADVTVVQIEAAEKNNAIVAFLKEQGIAETDIRTMSYNLTPRYRFESAVCTPTFCPPSRSVQDGFEVYQALEVKVRDISQAGDLLAGVGEVGATDISGLMFTIDDRSALAAEAREVAISDAKEKAEALATALGVRLVRLVGFYEDEGYQPMPYYGMGGDMKLRSVEMALAPDIQPGESIVKSRVTLTYKIK